MLDCACVIKFLFILALNGNSHSHAHLSLVNGLLSIETQSCFVIVLIVTVIL